MFTNLYRRFYIHGYFDRDQCRVQSPTGEFVGTFKSYRAAQLAIAKLTAVIVLAATLTGCATSTTVTVTAQHRDVSATVTLTR